MTAKKNNSWGALVVLSGGMDSTALLAKIQTDFTKVAAISFDYGQHHTKELEAAARVIQDFKERGFDIPHEIIQLPKEIFLGGTSTLVGEHQPERIPLSDYDSLQERFGGQPTVVPNRNMIMLSIAVARAEILINQGFAPRMLVFTGVHAGDTHNWHYPDCTPSFINSLDKAVNVSTESRVQVMAPFQYMTKGDIVLEGFHHNAPFEHTLSCYRGEVPACGQCATCLERIQAFKDAGYEDSIPYQIDVEWKPVSHDS